MLILCYTIHIQRVLSLCVCVYIDRYTVCMYESSLFPLLFLYDIKYALITLFCMYRIPGLLVYEIFPS